MQSFAYNLVLTTVLQNAPEPLWKYPLYNHVFHICFTYTVMCLKFCPIFSFEGLRLLGMLQTCLPVKCSKECFWSIPQISQAFATSVWTCLKDFAGIKFRISRPIYLQKSSMKLIFVEHLIYCSVYSWVNVNQYFFNQSCNCRVVYIF